VRLTDPETGSMLGKDFVRMSRAEVRDETWHIQMVFQDPFASLNPRHKAIELVAQGPIYPWHPACNGNYRGRGVIRFGRARSVCARAVSA
jgi:ABC-type microcin C transport system duplicated ATPase subunit YejF